MTGSPSISNPLPPRLSMDEYADFVEASLRDCDPALAVRQKEMEERIQTPFRMVEEEESGVRNAERGSRLPSEALSE